jgi:hypothetical protein
LHERFAIFYYSFSRGCPHLLAVLLSRTPGDAIHFRCNRSHTRKYGGQLVGWPRAVIPHCFAHRTVELKSSGDVVPMIRLEPIISRGVGHFVHQPFTANQFDLPHKPVRGITGAINNRT